MNLNMKARAWNLRQAAQLTNADYLEILEELGFTKEKARAQLELLESVERGKYDYNH